MADDATLIFFRSGHGDLDTAAAGLSERGMAVHRVAREWGDELCVGYPRGPQLRVAFVREPHVLQEAGEISAGTEHAAEMSQCDARYEIMIDDLDRVLDEIHTLLEAQITLQVMTGGFMFNTWNSALAAPDERKP